MQGERACETAVLQILVRLARVLFISQILPYEIRLFFLQNHQQAPSPRGGRAQKAGQFALPAGEDQGGAGKIRQGGKDG